MKILKRAVYVVLQCTWGILQTLAGAVVFLVLIRRKHFFYRGSIVTEWKRGESASIGLFLFISETLEGRMREEVLIHEYGHTFQSLILGPLYPFAVSIPSAVWCMFPACVRYRQKKNRSYYSFYTESWANRLGERFTGEKTGLLQ